MVEEIPWTEVVKQAEVWLDDAQQAKRVSDDNSLLKKMTDGELRAACLGAAISHFEESKGSLFDVRKQLLAE